MGKEKTTLEATLKRGNRYLLPSDKSIAENPNESQYTLILDLAYASYLTSDK